MAQHSVTEREQVGDAAAYLRCLQARVWSEEGPPLLVRERRQPPRAQSADLPVEALEHVLSEHSGDPVVWLDMELAGDATFFFKYHEPWDRVTRPVPDWTPVEPVLRCVGIDSPGSEHVPGGTLAQRTLSALPLAYELGQERIWREFTTNREERMPIFPAVGFLPLRPDDRHDLDFWVIPVNVGIIENTVITVRLPAHRCDPSSEDLDGRPADQRTLYLPERFLPVGKQPGPNDVAGAIAIYLAATARAVAERARPKLRAVESEALARIDLRRAGRDGTTRLGDTPTEDDPPPAGDLLSKFRSIIDIAQEVDRLLARLMRRLSPPDELRFPFLMPELRRRYDYALEEIRALQADLRDAGEMITGALAARHLELSQRHQATINTFERAATLFASLVLIPTLVAGAYGANVGLIGGDRHDFAAMLLLMFASSVAVLVGIRRTVLHDPWARWMTIASVSSGVAFVVAVILQIL